jgi:hypothetical protein
MGNMCIIIAGGGTGIWKPAIPNSKFLYGKKYLPPIEVTEALSARFREYLLDKFNGDTPANYFSRFKNVVKAATKQGYFKYDPAAEPCGHLQQ